jgi:hypothetical protein
VVGDETCHRAAIEIDFIDGIGFEIVVVAGVVGAASETGGDVIAGQVKIAALAREVHYLGCHPTREKGEWSDVSHLLLRNLTCKRAADNQRHSCSG